MIHVISMISMTNIIDKNTFKHHIKIYLQI